MNIFRARFQVVKFCLGLTVLTAASIGFGGCGSSTPDIDDEPVVAAPVVAPVATAIQATPTSAPLRTYAVTLRVTGEKSYSRSRGTLVGEKEDPRGGAVGPPGIASITTKGDPQGTAGLSQRLPWSRTFSVSNAYLEISASNNAPWTLGEEAKYGVSSAGILVAEILVDGQVVSSSKTTDERGVAACQYTVGKDPAAAADIEAFSNDAKDREIAELKDKISFQRVKRQSIIANADRDALTPSDLRYRLDDIDRVIVNFQEELAKLQSNR